MASAPGSGSSARSAPVPLASPPRRRRAVPGSGGSSGSSHASHSVRTPRRRSSAARSSMPLYSPNSAVNRMLQEDREAQRSGDAHLDLVDFVVPDDEDPEASAEQAQQIAEAIDVIRRRKHDTQISMSEF